jgi:hypothetical protein
MIVVISEPIRQLRDYFDGRRQAIYTDQQTGSSSYFLVLARYLRSASSLESLRPTLFIVDNILYRLVKGDPRKDSVAPAAANQGRFLEVTPGPAGA